MRDLRLWLAALAVALLTASGAAAQATLTGTVVDAETGDPLIVANVLVEELAQGAATDLDGRYRITGLAPGTYTVRFSYTGYAAQRVTDVTLADGETETIDVALAFETLEEVTVTAEALRDNNAALLRLRQRAPAVSDAIGADVIARAGASTASDALGKVTGASVVGGRYVVMRGLQGRYLNVQLNGATVPSADPDNNAVPLDLFPTGLLDNIITTKTFTPDRPGDFTGGSVNLATRDFPTSLTGSVGFSTGFESMVEPGSDLLFVPEAQLSVFGRPSGDLGIPEAARGEIPALSLSERNDANAQRLDAVTDAFSPILAPGLRSAPVDQGVSFSIGNQVQLAGRPLGFIAGLNWSRGYDGFSGGTNQTFKGLRTDGGVQVVPTFSATPGAGGATAAGSEEVLYGGIANLSYGLSSLSRVGLNLLYNRSAEAEAFTADGRYLDGTLDADFTRESRSLLYQERSIASAQLKGEHALSAGGVRVDWMTSLARTDQDEPDYRVFFNDVRPTDGGPVYRIDRAVYTAPTRYFRNLGETGVSGGVDVTAPLALVGAADQVKVGGFVGLRDRSFRERTFQVLQPSGFEYTGDPDAFFGGANSGVIGRDGNRNVFGNYIADVTSPQADYDGDQQVYAGYAMATLNVTSALRAIAGARVETTGISVRSVNPALTPAQAARNAADLSAVDVLPSLNLVYALSDAVNVRAAYGRTLARPNFRELAPFATYELRTNRTFIGNPDLVRTLVDNADLRLEWFSRPGEIVAVSAYYKRFNDPIELTYNVQALNPEVSPRNLSNASVYGVEIEGRRRLDVLPGALQNFSVGGNLTLAYSAVEITADELQLRLDPTETQRPLQGQSPFVLNLDLAYETPSGTSVGLFYNLFGSRLNFVALGLTPDVYEQARGSLDLTVRQPIMADLSIKAGAKNLLGSSYRLIQSLNGEDFVTEEYPLGRSFSVGVSYGF